MQLIVECTEDYELPDLEKSGFVLPYDTTCFQFYPMVRNLLPGIAPETELFFFFGKTIPAAVTTLGSLYDVSTEYAPTFLVLDQHCILL